MKRRQWWLQVGLLAMLLAGCGGPVADRRESVGRAPAPAWRLSYTLRGGPARFDIRFEVDATGAATYDRRQPDPRRLTGRRPSDADLRAAVKLVETIVNGGFEALTGIAPEPILMPYEDEPRAGREHPETVLASS